MTIYNRSVYRSVNLC